MENSTGGVTDARGESLPSLIWKDGHGNEHKVIDLDKVAPKSGVVIFEATTRKNGHRANEIPFRMCKDQATGVLIGICTGISPSTKNLQWMPIYLDKQKAFNCEIKDEAWKVACLLRSNIVEGSPNISKLERLNFFRVHDQNIKAANTIRKIKDAQRAISIAESLKEDQVKDMALALGIDTKHTNQMILMSTLLTVAQDNPLEFLRTYESPGRDKVILFKKAQDSGIITHDPMTGYYYQGVLLGINEVYVSDYFEKYPEIMQAIRERCEMKAKETVQAHKPVLNPELARAQQRIAELEAKLAGQSNDPQETIQERFDKAVAEANRIGGKMKQGLHTYEPTEESVVKLEKKLATYKEIAGAS